MGFVAGAVTASLGKLPGHSSSIIASRLKILAEGTSSGIGHLAADNASASFAARVTLSEDNLLSLSGNVAKKTVAALGLIDNITDNLSTDNLTSLIGSVTEGMVSNLDKIGVTDATKIGNFTNSVVENVVDALDEMQDSSGNSLVDSTQIEDMMGGVTDGATQGLGGLSNAGVSVSTLPTLLRKITKASARGLNKLGTRLLSKASALPGLLNKISSSAVGALKKISISGFDASKSDSLNPTASYMV